MEGGPAAGLWRPAKTLAMLLTITRFLIGLTRPSGDRDEGFRSSIAETHDLIFARSDAWLLTADGHRALMMDSKLAERSHPSATAQHLNRVWSFLGLVKAGSMRFLS